MDGDGLKCDGDGTACDVCVIGKTLAGMVRRILTDAGLPTFLWGELIQTKAHLANKAPHAGLKNVTPYKAIHNKESNLKHLRVIGARAFVHIETTRGSWTPTPWKGASSGIAATARLSGSKTPRRSGCWSQGT